MLALRKKYFSSQKTKYLRSLQKRKKEKENKVLMLSFSIKFKYMTALTNKV